MAENADVLKALEEIRRETIESRNMTIKTDNALKTLHAELKSVSQQQEAFQKRTWFSTGAAYLGFAVLAAVGAVAMSTASKAGAESERARLEKELKDLKATVDAEKAEAGAQLAAERAATDVYRMMTALTGDDRLNGVDALSKLDQSKLSPFMRQVLQDRAAQLKQEIGAQVLERGRAAFRKQDWSSTVSELSRYLALAGETPDSAEAMFFLGNAYFQSKQYAPAEKHLARFVELDKKARQRDFAMLLLVQANDFLGEKDKATAIAREALGTYPSSEFRTFFSNRVSRKTEAPAPAPEAPPANKPAPPAPAAPASGQGAAKPPPAQPAAPPAAPGTAATPAPKPAGTSTAAAPATPKPAATTPPRPSP